MENQTEELRFEDWILRVRIPSGEGPHPVALLLHGLSGDEKVMWVFASRMPSDLLMIAPRALHPFEGGGYTWHPNPLNKWPDLTDFRPAVQKVLELLDTLQSRNDLQLSSGNSLPEADYARVSLVGFSQGAALSYSLAMLHPQRVALLAGLAGFLPEGTEELAAQRPLQGKKVFITHGTKDQTVPVARARNARDILSTAGAEVAYCEEETGHKLSVACFRSLADFFNENKTLLSSAR
jgi:phospholipase/carboxylesterase